MQVKRIEVFQERDACIVGERGSCKGDGGRLKKGRSGGAAILAESMKRGFPAAKCQL